MFDVSYDFHFRIFDVFLSSLIFIYYLLFYELYFILNVNYRFVVLKATLASYEQNIFIIVKKDHIRWQPK